MDPRVAISIVVMIALFGTIAFMAWRTREPRISGTALAGMAEVMSVKQTAGSKQETRDLPLQIGLRVQVPGQQPYDVTVKRRIDLIHAGRVQPGATIPVKVDASNPQKVVIDFNRPIG
jgi:hypothetical protein